MGAEMNKLIFLPAARNEMKEIAKRHRDLVGVKSARNITSKIKAALENLRSFPRMGVEIDEEEIGKSGYRKLICGNYLCFYRVIDDVIYIYHIADGRKEYKQLF